MSEELPTSFLDFEHLDCPTERDIVQSLKNHPWVKTKINEDAPSITSYTLNIKTYNRWLKTEEGKEYGTRGCGTMLFIQLRVFSASICHVVSVSMKTEMIFCLSRISKVHRTTE